MFRYPSIFMPTSVDSEKPEARKSHLPARLHIFMDNFFGTCEGYDPFTNYLNYTYDIMVYSRTTQAYRDHKIELAEAFYEITRWRPGQVD